MNERPHDIGYLKRVDLPDGMSKLVDWSGAAVATVQTAALAEHSENLDVRRFRLVEHSRAEDAR